MGVCLTAMLPLLTACDSGSGGGGASGTPPKLTRSKTAAGSTQYTITAATHPLLAEPSITASAVAAKLAAADDLWVNDADGSGTNDYPANVSFMLSGSMGTLPAPWDDNKYNEIRTTQDLDALVNSPIAAWMIFVKSTPDGSAWSLQNASRTVVPATFWFDESLYAHEIGHNAGLPDRAATPISGLIPIMQSAPSGGIRELANAAETRVMIGVP